MTVNVELRGLAVWHGSRALVSPLDLQLGAGESITILGESGSGKSLLAHAIMGTIAANLKAEGSLRCDGREYDLADLSNRRLEDMARKLAEIAGLASQLGSGKR